MSDRPLISEGYFSWMWDSGRPAGFFQLAKKVLPRFAPCPHPPSPASVLRVRNPLCMSRFPRRWCFIPVGQRSWFLPCLWFYVHYLGFILFGVCSSRHHYHHPGNQPTPNNRSPAARECPEGECLQIRPAASPMWQHIPGTAGLLWGVRGRSRDPTPVLHLQSLVPSKKMRCLQNNPV